MASSRRAVTSRAAAVNHPRPSVFLVDWHILSQGVSGTKVYGTSIVTSMAAARAPLSRRFSVAPMMEWTDRHCRFFHRLLTRRALIYTEMITIGAIIHGDRARLLAYNPAEHPVALQLGGSDPRLLAKCARIAEDLGYDEVNLNVGCP